MADIDNTPTPSKPKATLHQRSGLGRIARVLHHGETGRERLALTRLMWPRGGLDYPRSVWRRDRLMFNLTEVLQGWLSLNSGIRCDGITPDLIEHMKRIHGQALAELLAKCRAR